MPETDCETLVQPRAAELLTLNLSFEEGPETIAALYEVDLAIVQTVEYEPLDPPTYSLEWQIGETRYRAGYVAGQLRTVETVLPDNRTTLTAILDCLGEPEVYAQFGSIERSAATVALLYPSRGQFLRFHMDPEATLLDPTTSLEPFLLQHARPGSLDLLRHDIFGDAEAWHEYLEPWPPH